MAYSRIIALLAGKGTFTFRSKEDRFLYVDLLETTTFDHLPRGKIVGLALMTEARLYDPILDGQNPWASGPYIYQISSTVRLTNPVPCKGNLGLIHLALDIQESIRSQPVVSEWIDELKNKYEFIWGDEDFRALTIKQPPVEAILCGEKTVENRNRSLFSLYPPSISKITNNKISIKPENNPASKK